MLGGGLAHHPHHRVDDVRLPAAIGADYAGEISGQMKGRGVDKGFEARKLDFGNSHGRAAYRRRSERTNERRAKNHSFFSARNAHDCDAVTPSTGYGGAVGCAIVRAASNRVLLPMTTRAIRALETFPNPAPGRDYLIQIGIPEFSCLCPKTGQPDFAHFDLTYVPDAQCIELKSLKLYIWSFRDEGHFHEAVTNQILDDIVAACQPRFARISGKFNVRGGTYPTITVEHRASDWTPGSIMQVIT
jgi:7-cyano-7-deazaguanine reductase